MRRYAQTTSILCFSRQDGNHQCSQFLTHRLGGILDLVFVDECSEAASWAPPAFSDHFVVFI